MAKYSFKEQVTYFVNRLNTPPSSDFSLKNSIDIEIDRLNVKLLSTVNENMQIRICLGFFLFPVRLERLIEILQSNFLGIGTGGCTLCLDPEGTSIFLKTELTLSTPPEENWSWLHRMLCVSKEWIKNFSNWEEFVPLIDHTGRRRP